jgi:hypothetical protein
LSKERSTSIDDADSSVMRVSGKLPSTSLGRDGVAEDDGGSE